MYRNPILHTDGNFDPSDWAYARSRIKQMMMRPIAGPVERHTFIGPSGNPISIWRYFNQPYMRLTTKGGTEDFLILSTIMVVGPGLPLLIDYFSYQFGIDSSGQGWIKKIPLVPKVIEVKGFQEVMQFDPTIFTTTFFYTEPECFGDELGSTLRVHGSVTLPDENYYWSKADTCNDLTMYTGGNKAQVAPSGPLVTQTVTRQSFELGIGGTVIDSNFGYYRTLDITQGHWEPGVGWMYGRLEGNNPDERYIFKHYISSVNAGVSLFATDFETNPNVWKYYVPIIALNGTKMLYRTVERTKDNVDSPCNKATITENLYVGTTLVESLTLTDNILVGVGVEGPDSLNAPGSYGYTLSGCANGSPTWSVSGGSGYTWESVGNLLSLNVDSSGCGTVTITGFCPGCSDASLSVKLPNGNWVEDSSLACLDSSLAGGCGGGPSYYYYNYGVLQIACDYHTCNTKDCTQDFSDCRHPVCPDCQAGLGSSAIMLNTRTYRWNC